MVVGVERVLTSGPFWVNVLRHCVAGSELFVRLFIFMFVWVWEEYYGGFAKYSR